MCLFLNIYFWSKIDYLIYDYAQWLIFYKWNTLNGTHNKLHAQSVIHTDFFWWSIIWLCLCLIYDCAQESLLGVGKEGHCWQGGCTGEAGCTFYDWNRTMNMVLKIKLSLKRNINLIL